MIMNEMKKTAAFVVAALLLAGGAAVSSIPTRGRSAADFNDQGEKFFPDFTNPLLSTELEVVDFDSATATPLPFKVMKKEGKWVIPSHSDYPADGKDRLAKTAAGVIDLRKDTTRSDSSNDHQAMGVIDPLDSKNASLEGRGKRVTLKDEKGTVLADLIIGKEVVGHPTQRYVRLPGKNRTYGVNLTLDLSTRFADWIETNLLKVDTARLREIVFDSTKVDPTRGTVIPGELSLVKRADGSAPWTMDAVPVGQEVDSDKLSTLTRELGDLKIVGVRPKPLGLTKSLQATDEKGINLSDQSILSLQTKGFHLTRRGDLLSNQGDVRVVSDDGVAYTLRYGEVTFATGEALSAGTEENAKASEKDPEKKKKDKSSETGTESRYLFVTATFESGFVPKTTAPPKPLDETLIVPAKPFARDADDATLVAQVKADKEKAEKDNQDYERRLEEGKKRARELTDRFAAWYYVVPGDSFRNVALDRSKLIRPISSKPATTPSMPGGIPGLPGGDSPFPALPSPGGAHP
jgi:Domain of unknown function (DUF4340)